MEFYGNRSRTITSVLHGFQWKSQGFVQIDWTLPPRRRATNQKAKAFCKSSSSWPLCMLDSKRSSPELPTENFCLTKTAKWSAKLCILKLQSAFMAAGGSLSSDGAGTTQAGSIHQRIWIWSFPHLLKLTCCKTERRSEERGERRRGEEKRGEGRKYRSGNISDLWKCSEVAPWMEIKFIM